MNFPEFSDYSNRRVHETYYPSELGHVEAEYAIGDFVHTERAVGLAIVHIAAVANNTVDKQYNVHNTNYTEFDNDDADRRMNFR